MAGVAGVAQLGATVRTKHEVIPDRPATDGTEWDVIEVLKQILLFHRALKCLVERLSGAQDQVDDRARNEEEDDDQRREDLGESVGRSRGDIAVGPDNEREPEGQQIRASQRQEELEYPRDESFVQSEIPSSGARVDGDQEKMRS
jgi:hypothetical protein